ncbi:Nicotinate N-methyltransferase 1, partial [Ancistrocladus abbreviatus]
LWWPLVLQSSITEKGERGQSRMTPQPASKATVVVDETTESRKRARPAIFELANMISVPMALNAIVKLNVADAIWSSGSNTPLSASQILSLILPNSPSADAYNLQRLLRILTSFGVFHEHLSPSSSSTSSLSPTTVVERRYSLMEIGKTLVTDEDGLSYGVYVLHHHREMLMKAWPLGHTAVKDPTTEPFVRANGEKAYIYYGKIEGMNELLQTAMAGVSVPFMRAVLGGGYDGFGGGSGDSGVKVERLVDVGGSGGDCLRMIMQEYENIKEGINFDLPEVVAKAPPIPGE